MSCADNSGKREKPADFAKLFNTDRGQILVMISNDSDDCPALIFTFDPNIDGISTSSLTLIFSDNDEGNENARKAFDNLDPLEVERVVFSQIDKIGQFFGGEE